MSERPNLESRISHLFPPDKEDLAKKSRQRRNDWRDVEAEFPVRGDNEDLFPPTEDVVQERSEKREESTKLFAKELHEKFPAFVEANEVIGIYESSEDKKERKEACRTIIRKFFSDPKFLENFYVQLARHEAFASEERGDLDIIKNIKKDIEETIEESIKREKNLRFSFKEKKENGESGYTERLAVVKEWIVLYESNIGLRDVVGKIIKTVFENVRGVEEFIYNLHTFSFATLQSSNFKGQFDGWSVLFFDTDVLPASEKNLDLYVSGLYSLDDETLKRALDIDKMCATFMPMLDVDRSNRRSDSIRGFETKTVAEKSKGSRKRFGQLLRSLDNDPKTRERLFALDDFHVATNKMETTQPPPSVLDNNRIKYPYNLFLDPREMTEMRSTLSVIISRVLTEKSEKNLYRLVYNPKENSESVVSFDFDDLVRIEKILGWFRDSEEKTISRQAIFETIRMMFPIMTQEQLGRVLIYLDGLQMDLRENKAHLVNPRGDKVFIEDEELKRRGFEYIIFKPRNSILDLEVTIKIGNVSCKCLVDENFNLNLDSGEKYFLLNNDSGVIIAEIVFSHLHKLLCDPNRSGIKTLGNERLNGKESKIWARRPFLRKLPPGQSCSLAQRQIALEKYGVDLDRLNLSKGFGKEEGQLTFVSPTMVSFEDAKKMDPLVSSVGVVSKVIEETKKK